MAAIQCDMCDTTFDTKQMRNDHILLLHGPLPDTVAAGDRDKEADDQDNTDVDKVIVHCHIMYIVPRLVIWPYIWLMFA